MKFLVFENTRLEFESALGDDFLMMSDWVSDNLTEEELVLYRSEGFSPEKQLVFEKWVEDQQITSIKYYVDDVLQS